MKKNFYRNLACMLIFTGGLCIATSTKAQVTVGSKGIPNAGALLDMKQKDKTDGSANSDKGLGLPRVALTAVDKLDPCVATTGNATTDDTAKKSHIGLTVYNTTDNTSTTGTLIEGVYAWDGAMWTQYSGAPAGGAENGLSMNGRKVILGGPLNQRTTITGDATNDLTLNTPTKVGSTLGVTGATSLASTLGVTGTTTTKATNVTGALTYTGTTPAAGHVLTSDASGKATWTVPVVNGAANGMQVVSNKVELGGALTKGTTIAQAGNSFAVTSTNTSTSSATFGTSNAALNLTSPNKGFMPPRVALKGIADNTTIPLTAADKGMTVYNIGTAFKEGLYTWSGAAWTELITQLPPGEASYVSELLVKSFIAPGGNSSGVGAITLPMQSPSILEKGSYAFGLRLYGNLVKDPIAAPVSTAPRCALYVFLIKNDNVILDRAELNFYYNFEYDALGVDQKFTNTTILTGSNIDAGDNISIKVSCFNTAGNLTYEFVSTTLPPAVPSAARTSMTYWKL